MITIRGLKKRYRRNEALHGIDLDIPEGKVTAFLGPNGAGKTTTIKCAMNLLDRDAGSVEVLGTDARKLKPEHWQRIGYVSENQKMPGWMTVPQLLDYVRPMYGGHWDRDFEKKLLADFDLPLKTKLRSLSRGQWMKAALVSSLAYRPRLVVLDEPFSGLDPLVRDEFLSGLLELTETEGWTVWISSHDIEEVERFADRVAILNNGRVDLQDDVETVQARFRAVEIGLPDEIAPPSGAPESWLNLQIQGRVARFTDSNYDESGSEVDCHRLFPGLVRRETRPMNLREIFVALAKSYRGQRKAKP
jgi:ABC-2 type transport system ATP-binding protein